ncbi:DUF2877 domain-containing protein [Blastococcus sp. BMG 814]|uniref:DUF2877 domain-containing protein n=1 Tax=Blastococcus carthaginiensis TaxID=3050034 RepID=A0ABT9I9U5_9ACTN|nr:DUF2877 domain-containing protein [Blastococcus carthaginiensis]MDP5181944.1 DUF2877 domain-containing protein [Blastococcus carthaginiensis]
MTAGGGASRVDEYAVSKAYLVPVVGFVGVVHSVFATACNIVVDGLLLTVQDAARQHTPTSVRVAVAGPAIWSPSVRVGDRAVHRAGVLSFGNHVLDLDRVPVWAPAPVAHGDPIRSPVHRRLACLAAARRGHLGDRGYQTAPQLERDVRTLGALLAGGLAQPSDCQELETAVARLIGAGAGLTPSGDDVLVGVLAALCRGGNGSPHAAVAFDRIGAIVSRHVHRTTDISAHYLRLAARGHVGEPLSVLVDSVLAGVDAEVVDARARDVLGIGASSGSDALLGVLTGLGAVLELPSHTQTHEKVA